jgi:hypothetical protein
MTTKKPIRFRSYSRAKTCNRCGAEIVFARVVATERGRGGAWMPFDATPEPTGRFAITDTGHSLRARPLAKDEDPDRTVETLAVPHQATCTAVPLQKTPAELPPNVIAADFRGHRRKADR